MARKKVGTIQIGIYGDYLFAVPAGALERKEQMAAEGQHLIDVQGSSRRTRPTEKEIEQLLKEWARPVSTSPNAKKQRDKIENGCYAVYFSNGDGKTFTAQYV